MCLKKLDLLTSVLFFGFLSSTNVSAQPTNIEPSSDTAQATDEQQKTPVQASLVSPKRLYEARVAMPYFLAGFQPFVAGSFHDGGWFVNGSALYSPLTKTAQAFILMEAGFGKRWVMRTGVSIEVQGGPAYITGLGEDPDFVGGRDDTDGLPSMWLPHAALRFGYAF